MKTRGKTWRTTNKMKQRNRERNDCLKNILVMEQKDKLDVGIKRYYSLFLIDGTKNIGRTSKTYYR